jgi:hypothetical protein
MNRMSDAADVVMLTAGIQAGARAQVERFIVEDPY